MMCLCECIHKHAASVCAGTCVNENAVCVSVYPHRAVWDFSLNAQQNLKSGFNSLRVKINTCPEYIWESLVKC